MICRYNNLRHYPGVFHSITGLRVAEFDQLLTDMLPVMKAAGRTRLQRRDRRRAPGAGRPSDLTYKDQLLMSVVRIRHYPTNELLGFLFGVSDSTASRVTARILSLLVAAGKDTMRRLDPGRKRHKTLDMLLEEIPNLAVLGDIFQQCDEHQQDNQTMDEQNSSWEQSHQLKSRVVAKDGVGNVRDARPSTTTSFLPEPPITQ